MAQLSDERRARYRQEIAASETPMRGQNKINYLKLGTGTTRVRILPGIDPSSPDKDFYCKAGTHYWANPNNPKLPVPCSKTKNPRGTCVICDKVTELKNSSNKADNVESEKLRARVRYYIGVIPREGDEAGKTCVYPAPKQIWTKIMSYMEDPEYGDITNPVDGCDVSFIRSGSGKETKYEALAARLSTPLSEDPAEVATVLASQPELWRFREAPVQEEVAKFMAGELDRFTTGGFAIKVVELPVDPFKVDNKETLKVAISNPVGEGMGLDPDLEVEPEPTEEPAPAPAPKKKFSNLDAARAELSK
jgi:hypothetical protein